LLTRLNSLSHPERAALQRGSIFGRRFWTGGVEAMGVQHCAQILGVLQPRGFVEEQPESAFLQDTEWSFHHNLLQEVTYESVLKRERAALHKVAAGWLERQAFQAGRLDEFTGLLGEHYQRAGELSAAANWYLRAGKRSMAQGAPRQAKVFFTRALELLPSVDRPRRWEALLGCEEALAVLGEAAPWKAGITDLLELVRSFADDNYLAEVYQRQATFGMHTGDLNVCRQAAYDALAAAQRGGNEPLELKALALLAMALSSTGEKTTAEQSIEEALSRARRLGDESLLAFVLFRGAFSCSETGDLARGSRLQIEQIELDHRRGDLNMEATGLCNLGYGYISLGLYKQARLAIEQSLQIGEALGSQALLAFNLRNLGDIYRASGDLRKARRMNEESLVKFVALGDARGRIYAQDSLGQVLLETGDIPGAARLFAECREIAVHQGIAPLAIAGLVSLANCAAKEGRMDEARLSIYEVWDYLKEHGGAGMDKPLMAYRVCADIFDVLGKEDIARTAIDLGHQALMEMADKISEPAWRQSFLENVPDNRVLMEMWERRT